MKNFLRESGELSEGPISIGFSSGADDDDDDEEASVWSSSLTVVFFFSFPMLAVYLLSIV